MKFLHSSTIAHYSAIIGTTFGFEYLATFGISLLVAYIIMKSF